MNKEIWFMVTGLFFAVIISLINTNFSMNCPSIGTRLIWTANVVFTLIMVAVFAYGAFLTFKNRKVIKRKKHHS